MTYRILVTGSRTWQDFHRLRRAIVAAAQADPDGEIFVIEGGAEGADTMAASVAASNGYSRETHRPNYDKHGQDATRFRNQHMVDLDADVCLAFATRWASGTGMCARMARKAGIQVIDYGVDTRMEARWPN